DASAGGVVASAPLGVQTAAETAASVVGLVSTPVGALIRIKCVVVTILLVDSGTAIDCAKRDTVGIDALARWAFDVNIWLWAGIRCIAAHVSGKVFKVVVATIGSAPCWHGSFPFCYVLI